MADYEWSDSRRVNSDCVDTLTTWYYIAGWRITCIQNHSWTLLHGQTVGGLTMYCFDAFITWNHFEGLHNLPIIETTVDDIEWLDSRRVDYVLWSYTYHLISYRQCDPWHLMFTKDPQSLDFLQARFVHSSMEKKHKILYSKGAHFKTCPAFTLITLGLMWKLCHKMSTFPRDQCSVLPARILKDCTSSHLL